MAVKNVAEIRVKAKKHSVEKVGQNAFEVMSASSGHSYSVTVYPEMDRPVGDWEAHCGCKWGEYHQFEYMDNGCSHIQAVRDFILTAMQLGVELEEIIG